MKRVGFDIGSTTIKCIVMDEKENILFKKYERHYSEIRNAVLKILSELKIIVPPIEQQNEFVAFVEQTDKSKLAIQQSLDKLELLKKALMQKYFG